jgi:hypothetical protein
LHLSRLCRILDGSRLRSLESEYVGVFVIFCLIIIFGFFIKVAVIVVWEERLLWNFPYR